MGFMGLALMGMLAANTAAYQPSFDPRGHRVFAGPANEVLVLGTPHLSSLPDSFKVNSLSLLLDRLAAWHPTIITVEDVSGPECEMLGRYKAHFEDAFDSYCLPFDAAAKATGLSVPAATAELDRLLPGWPAYPTPAARRHLAAVFMAAGERASALVQWLQLPVAERHTGDGLDDALVATLGKAQASRNESYALAAALAARLGLQRVYPAEDHTADAAVAGLGDAYGDTLTRVWKASAGPRLAAIKAEEAKLGTAEATLAYYRWQNRPQAAADAFSSDFGAALADNTPDLYGRRYAGWWQTRNLRMVSNIVAAMTPHPGARVLAVVGASHKGYFEAYLAMIHDVRLVDAEAVIR